MVSDETHSTPTPPLPLFQSPLAERCICLHPHRFRCYDREVDLSTNLIVNSGTAGVSGI
ncbi:hypothetical protein BN903_91 [Halorubrum sp. AJ67]|nr:hypothetical protein BN903_91 [Halorubrum sp. AJ67]